MGPLMSGNKQLFVGAKLVLSSKDLAGLFMIDSYSWSFLFDWGIHSSPKQPDMLQNYSTLFANVSSFFKIDLDLWPVRGRHIHWLAVCMLQEINTICRFAFCNHIVLFSQSFHRLAGLFMHEFGGDREGFYEKGSRRARNMERRKPFDVSTICMKRQKRPF